MALFPHDVTDLALAPVVLAVDAELEALSGMTRKQIERRVTYETNREPRTTEERRDALLEVVLRIVDLHGWQATWAARGLRLDHGADAVTIGVPDSAWSYISGAIRSAP